MGYFALPVRAVGTCKIKIFVHHKYFIIFDKLDTKKQIQYFAWTMSVLFVSTNFVYNWSQTASLNKLLFFTLLLLQCKYFSAAPNTTQVWIQQILDAYKFSKHILSL